MEEHEDKSTVRQHLRMMMSMMKLKQPPAAAVVTATTKKLEYLVNLPPVEFTISNFSKKKECNARWMSPPFYSHPQGHKFCLVVYMNGYASRSAHHLSVGVLLLEGDDDIIDRHLELSFLIDILDWREGKHYQEIVRFNSANNLMTEKGMRRSVIRAQFIPHSSLSYNSATNTEYLQNDCVRLRVSKVILYSTALLNKTPSWQNPHNGYQSLHEFTLTDFSKRKQFDDAYRGSSFYSHLGGYRFSIAVHSNGFRTPKGKQYFSLYPSDGGRVR